MTMTETNNTESQTAPHNTERELDCPAVPGSQSTTPETDDITDDLLAGRIELAIGKIADLEKRCLATKNVATRLLYIGREEFAKIEAKCSDLVPDCERAIRRLENLDRAAPKAKSMRVDD